MKIKAIIINEHHRNAIYLCTTERKPDKSQYTSLLIAIAMVVLIVGSILKSLKKE